MYYLCSENKGADQLRGYREADLRLCFRICKNPVFSRRGSNTKWYNVDGFSGQFFLIFEINCFCFVVAIFDLVHDVKAIYMT